MTLSHLCVSVLSFPLFLFRSLRVGLSVSVCLSYLSPRPSLPGLLRLFLRFPALSLKGVPVPLRNPSRRRPGPTDGRPEALPPSLAWVDLRQSREFLLPQPSFGLYSVQISLLRRPKLFLHSPVSPVPPTSSDPRGQTLKSHPFSLSDRQTPRRPLPDLTRPTSLFRSRGWGGDPFVSGSLPFTSGFQCQKSSTVVSK